MARIHTRLEGNTLMKKYIATHRQKSKRGEKLYASN
jgi:hypothetical protein